MLRLSGFLKRSFRCEPEEINIDGGTGVEKETGKENVTSKNFIEQIIEKDLAEGKYEEICTRFPPEPNG